MSRLSLMITLSLAALLFPTSGFAKILDRVVAIVGDQPILESDVSEFRRRLNEEGFVDERLLSLYDTKLLQKDRKAVVNYLIDGSLLDHEVRRKSLEVTFERVEQEIRGITKRQNVSRAQLKELLAKKGASFSEYQEFIKTSIQRQSLIEREVSSKIRISDDDVAAHYLAKVGAGKAQVYEYALSHILFLPSRGGEAAAKERAEKVLARLTAGESFDRLAEQFSEDPNFAQGGALGSFKSGEMLKELEEAVRPLSAGSTSGIVKTRSGLHLLKVVKKSLVSDPQLEARREEIRGLLFAETFRRQFRSWLDQRRDETFIRIND